MENAAIVHFCQFEEGIAQVVHPDGTAHFVGKEFRHFAAQDRAGTRVERAKAIDERGADQNGVRGAGPDVFFGICFGDGVRCERVRRVGFGIAAANAVEYHIAGEMNQTGLVFGSLLGEIAAPVRIGLVHFLGIPRIQGGGVENDLGTDLVHDTHDRVRVSQVEVVRVRHVVGWLDGMERDVQVPIGTGGRNPAQECSAEVTGGSGEENAHRVLGFRGNGFGTFGGLILQGSQSVERGTGFGFGGSMEFLFEARDGSAGGFLFCRLLVAPLPDAIDRFAQDGLYGKFPGVIGTTGGEEAIDRRDFETSLTEFLKQTFGVAVETLLENFLGFVVNHADDEIAHGRQALIEIERAEDGFKGSGEQGRACTPAPGFLSARDEEKGTEIELCGELGEGFSAHQRGTQGGELTFLHFGETMVEMFGGDKAQDGIAEILEALVVEPREVRIFVKVGAVGQGALEE